MSGQAEPKKSNYDQKIKKWEHDRLIMPKNKQFTCNKCPFVTLYKHHLLYHETKKHTTFRPFQCKMCKYASVNKATLNSHMKYTLNFYFELMQGINFKAKAFRSHSNEFHFGCQDCPYQTKYSHSLKKHLSKYNHKKKMDN